MNNFPIFLARKWILALLVLVYGIMAINYFPDLHNWIGVEDKRPFGGDFSNLWIGARLVLNGEILTLFDRLGFWNAECNFFGQQIEFRNWGYPLHFIPWILWLGFVPYFVGVFLWNFLTFAAYAVAVVYKRSSPWTLTFILALAPSSIVNIIAGQMGFLIAALLVGGLRLLEKRPILAGVLFGFLTFKPQVGLLVPVALLAGRHWRAIFAASLTTALLVGLSIACFGIEPWRIYVTQTIPLQREILETVPDEMYSFMMTSPFIAVRILNGSLTFAYAVAGLVAAGAAGAVGYAFFRPFPLEIRNAILMTAVFLCSPYMFCYDMPTLSAAVITMFMMGGAKLNPYSRVLLCAAWILPLLVAPLNIFLWLPITPLICAGLIWLQFQWARQPSLYHS